MNSVQHTGSSRDYYYINGFSGGSYEMIDRRKHPRSGTKTGTFALLRSTSIALSKIQDMSMGEIGFAVIKSKPVKMGQIININSNGLAFDYIERRGEAMQVFKLDILCAQDSFYLGKLLFKPVYDHVIDSEVPVKSFMIRRCGVQFGELTAHQKSRLEYFIHHHTIMQKQIFEDGKSWEDKNFDPLPGIQSIANALI